MVSKKETGTAYHSRAPGFDPDDLEGLCFLSVSFLYCVFWFWLSLIYVSCQVWPVSLDCPFSIAHSVFSSVFNDVLYKFTCVGFLINIHFCGH